MQKLQSQRQVYGETLVELGREDERIVVLEADLGKSTMSCLFQAAFPERYFEMGISEQNMTSFAAGLAVSGKIVFTNSFAVFAAGRSYDQIRQGICTAGLDVKICGSSAGLSDFGDGATHQAIEDVAIMRAIPGMTVLVPADGNETRQAVRAAARHEGPVYLRVSRSDTPDVLPAEREFQIGEPVVVREGSDIAVFACGTMVSRAMIAAEDLHSEGIELRVVNVSTLKPLKEDATRRLAQGMTGIITAEEHSVIGGLASVITYILRGTPVPVEPIAIMDCFGQSAHSHEELLRHYHLTQFDIGAAARKLSGSHGGQK